MARINRSDVIQKAVNDLALSQSTDKIPTETLDKVQLVYLLNKQFSSFVASNAGATSGTLTLTLPTIDSRSEIYLTSLVIDIIKDASCDLATGTAFATLTPAESGVATNFGRLGIITLTAQDKTAVINFKYPLRLKPNTNITFTGTYTLGVAVRSISVSGFTTSSA